MFLNTHFPKAKKYFYMGKFHDWSEGSVHPMSHALHYGTSVFEGIRAYPTPRGPAVFRLPEHIDRFIHSASVVKMTPPYGRDEMIDQVKAVVRENGLDACYIRPILFYSYGNLGLVPKACPVELVIGAWEWDAYLGEKAGQGVKVYILPWRRIHRPSSTCRPSSAAPMSSPRSAASKPGRRGATKRSSSTSRAGWRKAPGRIFSS